MDKEAFALAPQTILDELGRLESYPEALRRRVHGMAWMIWGLVIPAVFLTYSYAGLRHATAEGGMGWFAVLWIPWATLGVAATAALWRTHGLRAGGPRAARRSALTFALFAAGVFLAYVAFHVSRLWEHVTVVGPSVMLAMVGLVAVATGVTGLTCSDATERWLWGAGGVLLLSVFLVTSLLVGSDAAFALDVFTVVGPSASTLVFFGNGLYLMLRG